MGRLQLCGEGQLPLRRACSTSTAPDIPTAPSPLPAGCSAAAAGGAAGAIGQPATSSAPFAALTVAQASLPSPAAAATRWMAVELQAQLSAFPGHDGDSRLPAPTAAGEEAGTGCTAELEEVIGGVGAASGQQRAPRPHAAEDPSIFHASASGCTEGRVHRPAGGGAAGGSTAGPGGQSASLQARGGLVRPGSGDPGLAGSVSMKLSPTGSEPLAASGSRLRSAWRQVGGRDVAGIAQVYWGMVGPGGRADCTRFQGPWSGMEACEDAVARDRIATNVEGWSCAGAGTAWRSFRGVVRGVGPGWLRTARCGGP